MSFDKLRLFAAAMSMNFMVTFIFYEVLMSALFIVPDYGGSYNTVIYPMCFYAMGNVMAIPLGNKFPPKKILLTSACALVASTLLLFSATNYQFFNAFRVVQGFCTGALFVAVPNLLSEFLEHFERRIYIRNFTVTYLLATTAGGTVGGAIAYGYRWWWMVFFDLLFLIPVCFWFLWEMRHHEAKFPVKKLDYLGYFLYCINVSIIITFLTMGQELDWFRSHFLDTIFYLFLITFPYFILHEWGHPHPILNFSLFKRKSFGYAVLLTAFLFSSYNAAISLLSLWLHVYINYSADYVMVLWGIALVTSIMVSFFICKKERQHRISFLWIAIILLVGGCFFAMNFSAHVNFARIAIAHVIFGFALPLFIPPLMHRMLDFVDREEILDGIAIFQLSRIFFTGLGLAVYTAVWQRRGYFYHSRLGGELTSFSIKTREFLHQLKLFYLSTGQQNAEMAVALDEQSKALAINDTFFLIGVVMLFVMLSIPFYNRWRTT
ncbi:MAG: MFS transporter [Chlamydiales bacterium]|nr:MFS transporter [Chlamydiales bacterium]